MKNPFGKLLSLFLFVIYFTSKGQVPVANFSIYPNPACEGSNVIITDLSSNGPIAWSYTLAGATPSIVNTNSPIVTYNTAGIYSITLIASNASGASLPTVQTITIAPPPISPAITGSCQSICGSSTTLNATPPSIGTGTWSLISGTSTISNPNSPNTIVTGIGLGTNTYLWSVLNPGCISSATTCVIRYALPTIAMAGPSQSLCVSTGSTVMAANTPIIGTGSWSIVSGSCTIVSPNSPNTTILGLTTGTTILQWSIAYGCSPPSASTVALVVYDLPSSSLASASQTLCGSSTATITANTPTVGTGVWSLVSGTGVIAAPNSPTTTVNFLSIGTNVFQWTISNGPCPPSTSTIAIVRNPPPSIANAGASQTICATTTTLNGNLPASGVGMWTLVSGSGTIVSPTSPTTQVTGLAIGNNVFQWTISDGICAPSTSTVSVFVNACGIENNILHPNLFQLSPNPNNGEFTLHINALLTLCHIEIYNNLGELIKKQELKELNSKINISEFSSGIYHIRVLSDEKQVYKNKVIKN